MHRQLVPASEPATANARVPKCVTEEETTRSPRVADWSMCLLPTDVTGRQRSAMYDGASPCKRLVRKTLLELEALRDGKPKPAKDVLVVRTVDCRK